MKKIYYQLYTVLNGRTYACECYYSEYDAQEVARLQCEEGYNTFYKPVVEEE